MIDTGNYASEKGLNIYAKPKKGKKEKVVGHSRCLKSRSNTLSKQEYPI